MGDPMSEGSLTGRGLTVRFGGVRAVDGVDVDLGVGEILGLIGPNGAGKTTFLNVLSGYQRPTSGDVAIDGRVVTGAAPHRLSRWGVGRTFQDVRPFAGLTVRENIELGALGARQSPKAAHATTESLLERMRLTDRADAMAADLPHGAERRMGIARALAGRPRFLLLDEPAAGLNEHESDELVTDIAAVRGELGCGVIIIEHDMRVIMRLCHRIQVLDEGRTISLGTPAEVRADPAVLSAYLGTDRDVEHASG
jgi:branched-chain amino acid transport system ATP-binding protein